MKNSKTEGRGDVMLMVTSVQLSGDISEGVYHQGRNFLEEHGFLSVKVPLDLKDKEIFGRMAAIAPTAPKDFIVIEYHESYEREMHMPYRMYHVTRSSKKLVDGGRIMGSPIQMAPTEILMLNGEREKSWEVIAGVLSEEAAKHLALFAGGKTTLRHETEDLDIVELRETADWKEAGKEAVSFESPEHGVK